MTIKEVEERTGLARSNVRFYEKEKLIRPSRNERNGYRDYSQSDVENLKKIAYLRTLGISIEDIRNVIQGKESLPEILERQRERLDEQMADLDRAKVLCDKMLHDRELSYETLQVERYVNELGDYWEQNQPVFRLDTVSFVWLWCSFQTWMVLTVLCLLVGILFYSKLPPQIPVQWKLGIASTLVRKEFIFAYPLICIAIRYFLRPYIYLKVQLNTIYGKIISEYLSNSLCFVALSAEVFGVLFVFGLAENIVIVFLADAVVLLGLLATGLVKMDLRGFGRKE